MLDKLRALGVRVFVTENGRATIDKFEELTPNVNLIVQDIMMPKGQLTTRLKALLEDVHGFDYKDVSKLRTGHRVGQWIRHRSSQVPILGVSSVRDPEVIDWFQENGAGYVQKPCTNREI